MEMEISKINDLVKLKNITLCHIEIAKLRGLDLTRLNEILDLIQTEISALTIQDETSNSLL